MIESAYVPCRSRARISGIIIYPPRPASSRASRVRPATPWRVEWESERGRHLAIPSRSWREFDPARVCTLESLQPDRLADAVRVESGMAAVLSSDERLVPDPAPGGIHT